MFHPGGWLTRGKAVVDGTDTEKKLAELLLNNGAQVLSSFELNQIASLTFNDTVIDEIFDMVEEVLSNRIKYTPLCLKKSLVVAKHVLIYGAEDCIQSTWDLGRHINNLREYNTALLAQQSGNPEGWWQKVKGGSVDKGMKVREAAEDLFQLIQSKDQIRLMRQTNADPNSLVPVGGNDIAFISDDVRHNMLQRRMEVQLGMRTKSNLSKASDGFGGGFSSTSGKQVVGAAHGIEEMVAASKREKKRYTDDGPIHVHSNDQPDIGIVEDILGASAVAPAPEAPEIDLLDFGAPVTLPEAPEIDFLGVSSNLIVSSASAPADPFSAAPPASASSDLLGNFQTDNDMLGIAPLSLGNQSVQEAGDLLTLMNAAIEPSNFAHNDVDSIGRESEQANGGIIAMMASQTKNSMPGSGPKMSIMSSMGNDRFAALDELMYAGGSKSKPPEPTSSIDDAMQRILAGGMSISQEQPKPMTSGLSSPYTSNNTNIGELPRAPEAPPPTMEEPTVHSADISVELYGLTMANSTYSMPLHPPPMQEPLVISNDSTLKMGPTFGGTANDFIKYDVNDNDNDNDNDGGFLMGGTSGSGLTPSAPPPDAPPPPPPPC